jgi:hypothetical protein
VELLISVAVLGMVIGLASYAFSLFSGSWSVVRLSTDAQINSAQRLDLVRHALENSIPWGVRDSRDNIGFYFLGREEGLTLVTSTPVFSDDSHAVVRVFREMEGANRWRLVYEEAPLRSTRLTRADQQLDFRHRMIVMGGLASLRFRYFGWASLQASVEEGVPGAPPPRPQWFGDFDGLVRQISPQRIGLTLGGAEVVIEIPERVSTVVERLRVVE